jgi:hypothetical protein
LDYGLAVYPDDGELQEVLIRVADERLYQLKNGGRPPEVPPAASATAPPAIPEKKKDVPPPLKPSVDLPSGDVSQTSSAKNQGAERRRWERVSLASTRAYALIGEGVERTARVIDLGYGGVALETSKPEELGDAFNAVLHVPILPPVRVNLRRIYQGQGSADAVRIGCSFVT